MRNINEAMQPVHDTTSVPAERPSTPLSARLPAPLAADLLFQGRQEILIAHGDETYRLRLTRNGKLILTK